jgi:hypothetical protein
LHDIQLDYVRKCFSGDNTDDLIRLHNRLLKSYKNKYSDEWPVLPDDGYFPQNLAHHLIEAGRENELRKIINRSKERRGRFFVVGIGGCGGKITQSFLERQDSSRIDKLMRLIGSNISEDIKGLWLEADKNDVKNCQYFFGDMMDGCYPGFYIPHEVVASDSPVHAAVREKYGYDIKKQGFVRDAQYLKAIFEIFDTDREIQILAAKECAPFAAKKLTGNSNDPEKSVTKSVPTNNDFVKQAPNPIFDSAWNAIKPYTTLGGGDSDGIIFIVSLGGGTGTGFINPIINHIRNEEKADYPIFVLGILTEKNDSFEMAQFSKEGRRNLAAISAIYDLLTKSNGANGVILVDNQILIEHFGNDYNSANRFIRKVMLPMVLGRDYPGETPLNQAIAQNFSKGLSRPPVFVPLFSSLPSCRNSEEELVKRALEEGSLFGCTPEKADFAAVFCRGIIDSVKIRKALSSRIGINEKNVWVLRKMGDGDDEILILLRNPYGGDNKAYRNERTLENRFCNVITSALEYIFQKPEDLFYEGSKDKNGKSEQIGLTPLSKKALEKFFFGSEGFQKDNFSKTSGFVFELLEARRRLRDGKKPLLFNPVRIYHK